MRLYDCMTARLHDCTTEYSSCSHGDYFKTAPGYTGSFGAIMKVSSRMGISIRGVYQNDTNGDNSLTARAGVSIGL